MEDQIDAPFLGSEALLRKNIMIVLLGVIVILALLAMLNIQGSLSCPVQNTLNLTIRP